MALNINGTTGISGVDASVSAPALTGTDSNTGISFPAADTIKFSTGGVERMSITNSGITGISAGKLVNFATVAKEDTATYTGTTYADISGLSVAINGVSSGSKILVIFQAIVGYNCNAALFHFKLFRDSTFLPHSSGANDTFVSTEYAAGTNYNDLFYTQTYTFVDTHGQSAGSNLTYKIQGMSNSSGCTTYINRRPNSTAVRGRTTLSLLEIAA